MLEEELVHRMGGRMVETRAQGEEVLQEIKDALGAWLLQRDKEGVLVPSLVEPIDATIYVYTRVKTTKENVGSEHT